jgi:hypothetical protein
MKQRPVPTFGNTSIPPRSSIGSAGNFQDISERHFVAVCFIFVYFFVASGAGRAAESRQSWQVEWEKTLKAAETEGEVTVYVVDYPRFTVSQFQKHAAQVFLNWFLSREGQSLYQEHSAKSGQRNANSRRTDIPKDVIAPEYRLRDDAVFWENGPGVDQETAEATKMLKGILAKKS